MFDDLREAIERLDIPVDNAALAEVIELHDLLAARIATAVHAHDAALMWEADGATSMFAWLRDKGGMSPGAAKRTVTTGARLSTLPVTAAAWHSGELSGGQIQAIVTNVEPRLAGLFAEHEAEVVPKLVGLSVSDTSKAMQEWREKAKSILDPAPDDGDAERNELYLSSILDGTSVVKGTLDTDAAAIVRTAIRVATTDDDEDIRRTPAQRRADALVDVCEFFLRHNTNPPKGRNRPHVTAIVDLDDHHHGDATATLVDGGVLSASATARLLCDCTLHRVVMSGKSTILDYGTSTQSISPALYESLVARDQHCRFPGCDRPPWWCDGHHVVHYGEGGETEPGNLVLQCRRHHTMLHKRGWHAKLRPDGVFEVTDPNGRVRTTAPPGTLPTFG